MHQSGDARWSVSLVFNDRGADCAGTATFEGGLRPVAVSASLSFSPRQPRDGSDGLTRARYGSGSSVERRVRDCADPIELPSPYWMNDQAVAEAGSCAEGKI